MGDASETNNPSYSTSQEASAELRQQNSDAGCGDLADFQEPGQQAGVYGFLENCAVSPGSVSFSQ
jgi:hypothetical protein